MGREERSLALISGVRGGEGRREMAPSPQVPPVVGPAVTVALAQLKFPAAVAAAAGTVAGIVVNCVTWPTDLLVA